jgi:hypothetical protein
MQRLITTILTATMLAHAAFGCCMHHAHACATGCCDTSTAVGDTCSDCPCNTHDDCGPALAGHSNGGEEQAPHHAPHRCEGDRCNFVLTGSSTAGNSQIAVDSLVVLTQPASPIQQIAELTVAAVPSARDVASSTLRLHLVLAVLLI